MKNRWNMYFRVILSVSIILFLLYYIKVDKVYLLFRMARWNWFIILIGLLTVDRIFMAYKYSMLLRVKGVYCPFWKIVKFYYVGTFVGLFLPTTIGGDIVRVYGLSKGDGKLSDILSSIVMERLLGFLASLIVASVSMLSFIVFFGLNHEIICIVFLVSVIFLTLFLLSFFGNLWKWFIRKLPAFIKERTIFKKLEEVYDSYVAYKEHKGVLMVFLLYSIVEQSFPILGNYISAEALAISVSFMVFVFVIPIVQLISRMPISFNGIGVNEGLLVYFFSLLGLNSADGFSVGLMGHFAVMIATLPGFFVYLYGRDYKMLGRW